MNFDRASLSHLRQERFTIAKILVQGFFYFLFFKDDLNNVHPRGKIPLSPSYLSRLAITSLSSESTQ